MEIENGRVVLEYVTGIIEERDTQGLIRYEDDVISEYASAVQKLIHISDLMHLVLSSPKSAFIISWTRSKRTSFSNASLYHWVCRSLKEHKYLLSLAFRSLINDLCVWVCDCCVCVCTLCERVSWCVCLMMKSVFFFPPLVWYVEVKMRRHPDQ